MKQIPILLWGLLLPFSILQAQAVQGEITDSKQLPIEGATVVDSMQRILPLYKALSPENKVTSPYPCGITAVIC